jgi:hypothetical protein
MNAQRFEVVINTDNYLRPKDYHRQIAEIVGRDSVDFAYNFGSFSSRSYWFDDEAEARRVADEVAKLKPWVQWTRVDTRN